MEETRANFTTQGATIKNLEVQVGKIAEQLVNIPTNTFLSNNAREEFKSIVLRNVNMDEEITHNDDKIGEVSEDKKQEKSSAIFPQAPQVKAYVQELLFSQELRGQRKTKLAKKSWTPHYKKCPC
ncbi:hypothetical protein PIB30_097335 [Stylosanthes scabra]|uniref:Uncharacterized protein n=1 Tax=Stylosanthes scabra TaxID=79078 RepID=A0ABU6ZV18_9FABA|nr:hypothetical protein [Stylosanthes scabra]